MTWFDRSLLGVLSPFDLHVLGTPPAFILSQDQTLMFYLPVQNLLTNRFACLFFPFLLFWVVSSRHCSSEFSGLLFPQLPSGIFRVALLFICQGAFENSAVLSQKQLVYYIKLYFVCQELFCFLFYFFFLLVCHCHSAVLSFSCLPQRQKRVYHCLITMSTSFFTFFHNFVTVQPSEERQPWTCWQGYNCFTSDEVSALLWAKVAAKQPQSSGKRHSRVFANGCGWTFIHWDNSGSFSHFYFKNDAQTYLLFCAFFHGKTFGTY